MSIVREQRHIVLFSGEVDTYYCSFDIESADPDDSQRLDPCTDQQNGICGAANLGRLSFIAQPKDSLIKLDIYLYDAQPEIDTTYEEIVEVSFQRGAEPVLLCQWAHEVTHPLDIPKGVYRVRYSVLGFDKEYEDYEDEILGPIPGQRYLIQLWPQNVQPDRIIKQTTESANRWHNQYRSKR